MFHGRVVFVPEIGGGDSEGGTCGEEKAGNTTGVKSGSVMNRFDRAARHFLPMVRTHLWTQKRTLMQGLLRSIRRVWNHNDRIETSVRALFPPLIWPRTNNVFSMTDWWSMRCQEHKAGYKYTKMGGTVERQLRHSKVSSTTPVGGACSRGTSARRASRASSGPIASLS